MRYYNSDGSRGAFCGNATLCVTRLATELGAVIGMSAIRNNDRVGNLMFTDRIEHVVPPRKGRRHALRVIRDILAFERQWWKYAGAKEQAVRELFDMSATRYYQVLNALIDRPEALVEDPLLVRRLRRMRAERQRVRSARRLGFETLRFTPSPSGVRRTSGACSGAQASAPPPRRPVIGLGRGAPRRSGTSCAGAAAFTGPLPPSTATAWTR